MKRLIAPLMAASLLAAGLATAAPQDPPPDRQKQGQDSPQHAQPQQQQRTQGPGQAQPHPSAPPQAAHRQPPRRGDKLPPDQRGALVNDYRAHGLKRPPRGHQWRKVDDRYVLIAVATGVIANVIANGR
jgi:Ni/Co efflux regulator RcnB